MTAFLIAAAAFFGISQARLVAYAAATAAIVIAIPTTWIVVSKHYEKIGWNKAVAAIAAKDKGALDAVKEAKNRVDACYAAGRVWDTVSGMCQ